MAIFDRFKKGNAADGSGKGQRDGISSDGSDKDDGLPVYVMRSEKKLDKVLFLDLLRLMKSHDLRASIGVFSNTVDNFKKETGLVINKGIVPKKIVAYLQEMRMGHIEKALTYTKTTEPDEDGVYSIDDKLAGQFNLPADIIFIPIFSATRATMGVILVASNTIGERAQLVGKIRKAIK